jgi:predicted MFS family arabinose efflux permease
MILWGIGMGAQNSLLKSVIAPLLSRDIRATGFGLFDTGFGVAWFLGSWVMGILYQKSILVLVIFSVFLQLISLLVFALAKRAD